MADNKSALTELLEDEDRRSTGMALVGWGFVAVLAVVGAAGAWQFAPSKPAQSSAALELARIQKADDAEVTGSIRPADAGKGAPRPLAAYAPAGGEADMEALRQDVRELQRRLQQGAAAAPAGSPAAAPAGADQILRRLATIEDRLDKLERARGDGPAARLERTPANDPARIAAAERLAAADRFVQGERTASTTAGTDPMMTGTTVAPAGDRPPLGVSIDKVPTPGTAPAQPKLPVAAVPKAVPVPLAPVTSVSDDMKSLMDTANGVLEKQPIAAGAAAAAAATSGAVLPMPTPKPADAKAGDAKPADAKAPDVKAGDAKAPETKGADVKTDVRVVEPPKPEAAAVAEVAPAPAPAAQPQAEQAGVDLGSYKSLAGLKRTWSEFEKRHAAVAQGLGAVAQIRETKDGMEIRLVAGPYPTPADAARACASFKTAGFSCAPSSFVGQPIKAN